MGRLPLFYLLRGDTARFVARLSRLFATAGAVVKNWRFLLLNTVSAFAKNAQTELRFSANF